MSEENQIHTTESRGTPRWVILGLLVPTVIAAWALWSSSIATHNANLAQQNATAQLQQLSASFDKMQQHLADSEQARAHAQSQLDTVDSQLRKTQGALGHDLKANKQFKDQYDKQMTDVQDNVKSVKNELATKASADDLKTLSGDVSGVRTDLDSTKQGLQMARSEFGTLIARNHEEIDQLRRMGQRDYYEFTLSRKGDRQKVGNITVELRGTNVGKGLYTLRLGVDDMNLEKKNRSVNEPIFFYTQGSRSSLELVINKVGKNSAVGYLSVPKSTTQVAGK